MGTWDSNVDYNSDDSDNQPINCESYSSLFLIDFTVIDEKLVVEQLVSVVEVGSAVEMHLTMLGSQRQCFRLCHVLSWNNKWIRTYKQNSV